MIKAIISDLGNVIVPFDWSVFCRSFSKYCNLSEQEIKVMVIDSNLKDRYEKGKITSGEFYKQVKKITKSDISYRKFCYIWSNIFTVNRPLVDLLNKLRKSYNLFLLSNTNEIHFRHMRKRLKVLSQFKGFILSYKVGSTKPDLRIFLEAVKSAKCKPEECVYIDDIKEYSDVASRVGMRGINYKTASQLQRELRILGVVW
ncbi:MAG: HAD family phosphatase [Candidatus Aenigmarchaeota archaeon]|nr:HAD family phosphatase [Candidatus Aenigmarchaeota archaeon]